MSLPLQPPMRPGQGGYFRTFLIGGGITAAILSGAWMSMLWAKKRQQIAGRNPYYEHILQNSASSPSNFDNLKPLSHKSSHYSMQPPAHVNHDHTKPHFTIEQAIEQAKLTGADINEIRRMVPSPQRGRNDGSGRAYPKSPDYVDNYGKTVHARSLHNGGTTSTNQKTEGLSAW